MDNKFNGANKRSQRELIAFPANPFVALADFVVVLVMILMLAFMHQALSNSRLIERLAVDQAQHTLLTDCTTKNATGKGYTLRTYFSTTPKTEGKLARPDIPFKTTIPRFYQSYVDGDLQRLHFDNLFGYDAATKKYNTLTSTGEAMMTELGAILAIHQGDLKDPGSGLFKRVIVEGHADKSEGINTWNLSLARALTVAGYLQKGGLSPQLIEVSGRGIYFPAVYPVEEKQENIRVAKNRYLDVVIVFSGGQSLKYRDQQSQSRQTKAGKP